MTIDSKPDWIKGIKSELDYGWRYHGNVLGILPDTSVILNESDTEIEEALADKGVKDSSSASCFQCGTCSAICPYTLVTTDRNGLSARRMLHEAQLGLTNFESEETWLCTTCGACVSQCPRGVEITDFMKDLRRIIVEYGAGYYPKSLRTAMSSIASLGNPFGEPLKKRATWVKTLNIKPFTKGMELLYFLGCFPAYDPRVRKVAQDIIGILKKVGVDFGILGSQESCCGESVRKAGNEELFRSLAHSNIHAFAENGVKKIITTSPHCYHTFKNEYPQFGVDLEVTHYTQYLAQLIKEGRLKFSKALNRKVTYHDPCYLGRHNGIYEEPREILRSIPGLELIEMPDSGQKSVCCGGGGGRIWLETKKEERLTNVRLEQAIETGANVLAVSCPYCLTNFEDSLLTVDREHGIQVKDIAELAWEAIPLS